MTKSQSDWIVGRVGSVESLNLGVWDQCINLALEAYNAGSVGIAAIVVDKSGKLVAKGRNQLNDDLDSGNIIKMTSIAHAEMNALNNIPRERQQDRELVLYTTVEPCPMCLGAIVMSKIRKVIIGSADPYTGSVQLLEKDDYLRKKGITVEFAQGKGEEMCFALHYLSLKRDIGPLHPIFSSIHTRYPVYAKKLDNWIEASRFVYGEPVDRAQLLEMVGC